MNQDATWYGGRPRPTRHCVKRGSQPPPQKGGGALLPNFRPISIVAKGLDAKGMPFGMEVGLNPGDFVRWEPRPSPKGGGAPNFRPMSIAAKRLHDHDATGYREP